MRYHHMRQAGSLCNEAHRLLVQQTKHLTSKARTNRACRLSFTSNMSLPPDPSVAPRECATRSCSEGEGK